MKKGPKIGTDRRSAGSKGSCETSKAGLRERGGREAELERPGRYLRDEWRVRVCGPDAHNRGRRGMSQ